MGMALMSRTIALDTKPYDYRKLFLKKSITFDPGITVLVGCNGSGKTTVLDYVKRTLKKENVPFLEFNNLSDGGQQVASRSLFYGRTSMAAAAMVSSEGERINLALGEFIANLGGFVRKNRNSDELWLLFDAMDSGLSIDNIEEMKGFFKEVLFPDTEGQDLYVIMPGNQYSLAEGENYIDVRTGKTVRFSSYEDYKKFILKSRDYKNKSYEQ